MKQINKIKENFIFSALYEVTSILVPLATTPYLSRVLHAEGIGKISFAYAVANYFYIIVRLGLHSYGNRTIAFVKEDKKLLSQTFYSLYFFQLFLGILMSVAYIFYCFFLAQNKQIAFAYSLVVFSATFDLTWMLHGLEEFRIVSVRDILTKLTMLGCVFAFVKGENAALKYAIIYCVGYFINQVIVLPVVIRRVNFYIPNVNEILVHIKPNFILFLPTIAVSLYRIMDKIMLGRMASDAELGYYHNCESVIKVPLALITALGTIMLPRMSNMLVMSARKEEMNQIFDRSIAFAMLVSSSMCFGMMAVAREFVPFFYGKGYDKCVYLFYIILPSCLFISFANVIRTQYLLPRKKDTFFVISLFLGATTNVILNLVLIPEYKAIGAAAGTLIAEGVVCIAQAIYAAKDVDIWRNARESLKFLIAGGVMFALISRYSPHVESNIIALVMKVVLGCICYLTILGCEYLLLAFERYYR